MSRIAANRQLVLKFYQALSENDLEGKAALVSDSVTWWIPASGAARTDRPNPARGKEQWLAFSGRTADRYERWHWTPKMIVADEDHVAVLAELEATPHGRATHRLLYGMFMRIEGGLIDEVFELADTAAIFERLSL